MKGTEYETYSRAVREGDYDLHLGNLFGKYDNVRTYWEDQVTRHALRPHLQRAVKARRRDVGQLRVLDLGCGAGQGFELLSKIDKPGLDLGLHHKRVIPSGELELYLGLDISHAMVEKGRDIYAGMPNVRFEQADLGAGLGSIAEEEDAFDVYFSSYGSLSHLSRKALEKLMTDIGRHARNSSLLVLDMVGRYSIEWPQYWQAESEEEKYRDYSMSYLLSEEERRTGEIERFPLRFWTGREVQELVRQIAKETGTSMEIVTQMDRSILTGRHVDTGEYNSNLKPLRRAVNSLHEDYIRTDLNDLLISPSIVPDHPEVSEFLKGLIRCWNILVKYTQERLQGSASLIDWEGWGDYPSALQFAMMTVDRVISDVGWMWFGDPRANIIEPQLGYALRSLENSLQAGLGAGHGHLAIIQIHKID